MSTTRREAFLRRWIQAHRHVQTVAKAFRAFFSDDPWAVLSLVGIRNWSPIHHKPDRSRPIPYDGGVALIVSGPRVVRPAKPRKVFEPGEALGPEDFELGLQVPPASDGDPTLETAWLNRFGMSMSGAPTPCRQRFKSRKTCRGPMRARGWTGGPGFAAPTRRAMFDNTRLRTDRLLKQHGKSTHELNTPAFLPHGNDSTPLIRSGIETVTPSRRVTSRIY